MLLRVLTDWGPSRLGKEDSNDDDIYLVQKAKALFELEMNSTVLITTDTFNEIARLDKTARSVGATENEDKVRRTWWAFKRVPSNRICGFLLPSFYSLAFVYLFVC